MERAVNDSIFLLVEQNQQNVEPSIDKSIRDNH